MKTINQSVVCEAALRLFMGEGQISAITISAVADEAGCDTRDVYRQFANRDALLNALQVNLFDQLLSLMQAAFGTPHANAQQRLYRLMDAYVSYARENPERYRLMFDTPRLACPRLAKKRVALMELGTGAWQAVADAGYGVQDARTTMRLTWATLHGLLRLEANDQLNLVDDFDAQIAAVLESVLGPRLQARLSVV